MKHQTNTTLSRKPSNTMHKNEGLYKPRTAETQSGDGASFAFNGQMGDGVNRSATTHRFAGNQHGHLVKNPDSINHGLIEKNRKGNASDSTHDRLESVGPSVTKDPLKTTIATASGGHPTHAGATAVKRPPNPDAIFVE